MKEYIKIILKIKNFIFKRKIRILRDIFFFKFYFLIIKNIYFEVKCCILIIYHCLNEL